MKGFGVYEKGKAGWMEKADYLCGPEDGICRPLAPCSSDVHSALEREGEYLKNRIPGHESIGQIIEAGSIMKDFKVGEPVVIPCTAPTWKHPTSRTGPIRMPAECSRPSISRPMKTAPSPIRSKSVPRI